MEMNFGQLSVAIVPACIALVSRTLFRSEITIAAASTNVTSAPSPHSSISSALYVLDCINFSSHVRYTADYTVSQCTPKRSFRCGLRLPASSYSTTQKVFVLPRINPLPTFSLPPYKLVLHTPNLLNCSEIWVYST